MRTTTLAALGFALSFSACALFSKGEIATRRYFSPELPASTAPGDPGPTSAELRLGRVTARDSIAERIMFRESATEVGFYDDWVWTEKPEAYLRRGLTRVLFEEKGLRGVLRGTGPTLDVELLCFEEVKGPQHVARVQIAFSLNDQRTVSLQETASFERPIPETTAKAQGPAVAQALAEALRDAVYQVSERVVTRLAETAPPGSPRSVAKSE